MERPFSEQLSGIPGHSRSNSRNCPHDLSHEKTQFSEQFSERFPELVGSQNLSPNSWSALFFLAGVVPARKKITTTTTTTYYSYILRLTTRTTTTTPRFATFRRSYGATRAWWPPPSVPTHPDPILTPFLTRFDLNSTWILTPNRDLLGRFGGQNSGRIQGQTRVRKGVRIGSGVSGVWGWGHPDRSGSVAPRQVVILDNDFCVLLRRCSAPTLGVSKGNLFLGGNNLVRHKENINSVQTRCIVKGEAQKSLLFWRFSGGFWFFSGSPVL